MLNLHRSCFYILDFVIPVGHWNSSLQISNESDRIIKQLINVVLCIVMTEGKVRVFPFVLRSCTGCYKLCLNIFLYGKWSYNENIRPLEIISKYLTSTIRISNWSFIILYSFSFYLKKLSNGNENALMANWLNECHFFVMHI